MTEILTRSDIEQNIPRPGIFPKFQGSAIGFKFRAGMFQMCQRKSRILARSRLLCQGANPNDPGLRSSGAILSGTEKENVGVLLGDAMGSKVTLKKFRTVEEKGNVVRAATCSMGTVAKSQRQTTLPR